MARYAVQVFFSRFFSRRYAGQVDVNPLLVVMYRFAFPFAVMLSALRLSPNQITTLSLLSAAISAVALALGMNGAFCAFWGAAVLLDFCDGTVARMTGKVRTTAFRYDHSSDLVKIFLIILGAGYRYDAPLIWGLCLATSFAFMFYMVINHDLGSTRQRLSDTAGGRMSPRASDREPVSISQALRSVLLTINGHTLLVFFFLPLGETGAILGLSYFLMLSLLRAARCIHVMLGLPK